MGTRLRGMSGTVDADREGGGKRVDSEDPREPEPGCHNGQMREISSSDEKCSCFWILAECMPLSFSTHMLEARIYLVWSIHSTKVFLGLWWVKHCYRARERNCGQTKSLSLWSFPLFR